MNILGTPTLVCYQQANHSGDCTFQTFPTNAKPTMKKSAPKRSKTMAILKGVVFDLDGTLVRSNLDTQTLYPKVLGTDVLKSCNISTEVQSIEKPEERVRAQQIIHIFADESRQKMTFMPGCVELLTYLSLQNIPTALTSNSRKDADFFCEQLQLLKESAQNWGQEAPPDLSFRRIITRDDQESDLKSVEILAKECFNCECSEIIVVGNSVTNHLGLWKKAGAKTALLAKRAADGADLCVQHLTELPKNLWKIFFIDGPLGNTPENDYGLFHRSPQPKPQSELCQAVANGDLPKIRDVLKSLSLDEITKPDDNGNTALIWAAETGNVAVGKLIVEDVLEKSIPTHNIQRRLANFQNHRGYLGATALNRAARRNHTDFLEFLLREGDRFDMNLPNYKMQYPLHFCANKKNPEALDCLLMCGANPWVLDRKGRTPLEDSKCKTCDNLLLAAMSVC